MLQILTGLMNNPIWTFLGGAAGIVGVIISIVIFLKQKNYKKIFYELVSNAPIFSIEEEAKGKVLVLFNGKSVDDVHLVVLKLINAGNTPIMLSDYAYPIEFDFGDQAEILDTAVLETIPIDLKKQVSLVIKTRSITMQPLLLNSKDTIVFKTLLTHFEGKIIPIARIAGVNQILKIDKKPPIKFSRILLIIGLLAVFMILGVFFHSFLYCCLSTTVLQQYSSKWEFILYFPSDITSYRNAFIINYYSDMDSILNI